MPYIVPRGLIAFRKSSKRKGDFESTGMTEYRAAIKECDPDPVLSTVIQVKAHDQDQKDLPLTPIRTIFNLHGSSPENIEETCQRKNESFQSSIDFCNATGTGLEFTSSIGNKGVNAITKSEYPSTVVSGDCSLITTAKRPIVDDAEETSIFIAPMSSIHLMEESSYQCREKCYIIPSKAHAVVMKSRGYQRLKLSYCKTFLDLPEQLPPPSIIDIPLHLRPPPTYIDLPTDGRVPPLENGERSIAEKIVMAFEEKVINEELDTVHSPLRLWNKAARRQFHLEDSNFTARCNCYYAIRTLFKDTHPDQISYTVSELKQMALDATKTEREALAKRAKRFNWHQECVTLYEDIKKGSQTKSIPNQKQKNTTINIYS